MEEYQCGCRIISWHYVKKRKKKITNLRVFTAVHSLSSSLILGLAQTQGEIANMHLPEAAELFKVDI